MAKKDILPDGDPEFDTLQEIIVAAVSFKRTDWKIPTAEIDKLTDKKSVWNSTWAIAKDKQNSTTAQKKARTLAREEYEKVLRPFIQKWIYLNENMDSSAIKECGLKPHESTHNSRNKPGIPTGTVKRGATGSLIATAAKQDDSKEFGCIMTENAPLPDNLVISPSGKLTGLLKLAAAAPDITDVQMDLSVQRKKLFTSLKPGRNYYFYFYAYNTAGVSGLSQPVMIMCW